MVLIFYGLKGRFAKYLVSFCGKHKKPAYIKIQFAVIKSVYTNTQLPRSIIAVHSFLLTAIIIHSIPDFHV